MSSPPPTPRSLVEAVAQVADCPCADHERAFVEQLAAAGELVVRATAGGPLSPADRPEPLQVATVSRDGRTYLLACPDIDAARRHDAGAWWVGIPTRQVAAMVLADGSLAGIMVVAATDDDAWAVARRAALADLVRGPSDDRG